MNQKELKELESRCIQEEAPTCAARCPIHVDVRGFLKKASSGSWNEAVQTLAVTMPFPGILGRICDHPCEAACIRSEAGGAIAISSLEKRAVEHGALTRRRIPLPQKSTTVAIAGGGLCGLTAAWDLAYKGYKVTLFQTEGGLGGALGERVTDLVPRDVIESELAVLTKLGVEIRPVPQGGYSSLLDRYDAVYVSVDSGDEDMTPDPLTLETRVSGLFVHGTRNPSSPIEAVADGRKAAVSIDRFLQKVSLTAGREKEGPYETRLFTSLKGVELKPRVKGSTEDEARKEAARCLQCECMECVKVCLYLERFKGYPKQYVRQISNNATIVLGNHGQVNSLINSCSLCGLCAEVCPTSLSMAGICREGRENLVERGKMPPSVHEFALLDMRSANDPKSTVLSHEPGKEKSAFAFFPGCQLGASTPDHVIHAIAYLRERLEGGVGLMVRCCGAPAEWAGRADLFSESMSTLLADWETLGRPVMIVACPACYKMLKDHCPSMEITTLWEVMAKDAWEKKGFDTFAIHDPCTTRHEPAIRESVRRILSNLGVPTEELPLSGDTTECCGFGGLMSASNPPLARDVAKKRASRSTRDYVTYCAMCRSALQASGKKVVHLLDLLFGDSPVTPGLVDRREGRYRLKERLTEKGRTMEEYELLVLHIAPPVRELMEERRILIEDVQKTIHFAETRFRNKDRWLASYRPAHVTYWVEYTKEEDGYTIVNAYCHRMEVAG